MQINKAEFLISSPSVEKCPKPDKPEFAFIGRSNVGKSSLINMLCGRKELAKTSSKPGKTQTINHFIIDEKWYLVDLPGYGFASVSKVARDSFEKMISDYLTKRQNLINVFVLIDSRLPLQRIDNEFMHWLGEKEIPFSIVFTKTDKLSLTDLQKNLKKYEMDLSVNWEEIPPIFITSAEKKRGGMELLEYINENSVYFKKS